MNREEFIEVANTLKGNWRFMLQTQEELLLWFTHLKEYSLRDAKGGAVRYILSETTEPKIRDIIDAIDAYKASEKRTVNLNERMVHCIYCKDTGLIVTESPTGVKLGRPCRACKRGEQRYPWEFMDKEEQEEWMMKEVKKGRNVPRPVEAPKEFYETYTKGKT